MLFSLFWHTYNAMWKPVMNFRAINDYYYYIWWLLLLITSKINYYEARWEACVAWLRKNKGGGECN